MIVLIAGGGTGGHLMPALAIADALREVRPDVEPVLVGARRGVDASILSQRPYRYHLLPVEPIYRHRWWRNARWAVTLPRVVRACRGVLRRERPALVIGTGGYAAGPVLWMAARGGIPIVLQEQNAMPGITTRRLARHARQIHLGFPEAEAHLVTGPDTDVVVSGNPIAAPGALDAAAAKAALEIPPDRFTVFVVGGSQGAHAINQVVADAVRTGAFRDVALLWSTGPHDVDALRGLARPPEVQARAFWDPIGAAYAAADLVVARAGAMTTAELLAWGLPSVLIPLPTAAADHQASNAEALAAAGAAVHLPERSLSVETLIAQVQQLRADPAGRTRMAAAARDRGRPGAARTIAEHVERLLGARPNLS